LCTADEMISRLSPLAASTQPMQSRSGFCERNANALQQRGSIELVKKVVVDRELFYTHQPELLFLEEIDQHFAIN